MMNMKKISRSGFINAAQERKVTHEYIDKLRIATSSIEKEASKLSGGNQQKVVFAKCLFADADLLMLDEPTRGIDVGAKSEIYGIIRGLSKEGKSIMIFSSELPEIMNICDSIYLLYDGSLKASLRNGCEIDSEKIIHVVTGGNATSAAESRGPGGGASGRGAAGLQPGAALPGRDQLPQKRPFPAASGTRLLRRAPGPGRDRG